MKNNTLFKLFDEIETLYNSGIRTVRLTMQDGNKETLRLFRSANGTLAYFGKGKRRRGYALRAPLNPVLEAVKVEGIAKKEMTAAEKYVDNLRKFKVAFTTRCHVNLWEDLRAGYAALDVDDFATRIEGMTDRYEMYLKLVEYCKEKGIRVLTENRYKTTTVAGNGGSGYIPMIREAIENKRDFNYYWRDNYDVTVSGRMCSDGYRAWLSLEFRGCGNGHYYLLINANSAVFCEDD